MVAWESTLNIMAIGFSQAAPYRKIMDLKYRDWLVTQGGDFLLINNLIEA